MKRQIALLLSTALALALPGLASASSEHATRATAAVTVTDTQAALRDLWLGHVFWVRNVVDVDGSQVGRVREPLPGAWQFCVAASSWPRRWVSVRDCATAAVVAIARVPRTTRAVR